MKIGKFKLGWWKACHEVWGETKPYLQILCIAAMFPLLWIGKLLICASALVADWSFESAKDAWDDIR